MKLMGPISSGVAAGSAGSATANQTTTTRAVGRVMAIYVKYNDSPPVTTDVTIATDGTSPAPPAYSILTLTDANTDGWFYPRVQIDDTTGTPIAAEYSPLLVHDLIKVTIAGANASDSVDVWLMLDESYAGQ